MGKWSGRMNQLVERNGWFFLIMVVAASAVGALVGYLVYLWVEAGS